jgi:hypothetical protein
MVNVMSVNVVPPPRYEPVDGLERDINEYMHAWITYCLRDLSVREASYVLRRATARLRALAETREADQ